MVRRTTYTSKAWNWQPATAASAGSVQREPEAKARLRRRARPDAGGPPSIVGLLRYARIFIVALCLLTTGACEGGSSLGGGRDECSPSHSVEYEELGEIVVQQAGKNKAIAWGVKAKKRYRDARFKLKIYAGDRKVDDKNQDYAPHGSQNAARAKKYSGKVLQIVGTAKKDGDTVDFDVRCHIA